MNLEGKEEKELYDSSDDNGSDYDGIQISHHNYLKYKARKSSLSDSNNTKDSFSNTFLPYNQIIRE